MLRISQTTTKKILLQYLTAEAGKQGNLVLQVDALPPYLDTYISFRVFAFQISNYPRPILWYTNNQHLLAFLKECGVTIFIPLQQNLLNYNEPKSQDIRDKTSFTTKDIQNFSFPSFPNVSRDIKNNVSINAQELINDKTNYKRSSLLDEPANKTKNTLPNLNTSNIQNFDTWIEKIAATKEALNTIKESKSVSGNTFLNNYLSPNRRSSNLFKFNSRLIRNFSLAVLALSTIGFIGFALFPTSALTVEIQSINKDKQIDIEVPQNDFQSKKVLLKNEKNVETTEFQQEKIKYATGKVSLVNLGGNSIDLDNGAFKVVKDGKEYKATFNTAYSRTFTIPVKGSLNDFQVQATKEGDVMNLAEGTKLDITNLSGVGFRVCSNCFALVTSEIKNIGISNKKVVSDATITNGKKNLEENAYSMRESEIKNLSKDQNITDKSWYKNSSVIYNFDKSVGDVTDNLKIQGSFETTLFYLSKSDLEYLLKKRDSDIFKINNVLLSSTTGNFEDGKTALKLKIYYTYAQQDTCFDKEDFVNTLSSKSFNEAIDEFEKKCPNIKNIDKKDSGLTIPGLQTKIDINVVKN